MIDEIFKIKLISVRDCFLHFSSLVLQKLSSKQSFSVIKLIQEDPGSKLYFTWAPQPCCGLVDNYLGISAVYARHLGLLENATVVLSICDHLPAVRVVSVSAATQDDYEIIELSQNELQSSILNQVRVISVGQPLTVWFSRALHCTVYVESLDLSSKIGMLEHLTDIVISPSVKEASSSLLKENHENFCCVPHKEDQNKKLEMNDVSSRMKDEDYLNFSIKLNEVIVKEEHTDIFRVIVLSDTSSSSQSCCGGIHNSIKHPYNAFMNKKVLSNWANRLIEENSAIVCFLSLVPSKFNKDLYKNCVDHGVHVRIYPVQDNCLFIPGTNYENNFKNGALYVSNTVKNIIHLKTGSKVKLKVFVPCLETKVAQVDLSYTSNNLSYHEIESWFRDVLSRNGNTLINNNAPMPVETCTGELENVIVSFLPSDILCWPFSCAELKTCKIEINYLGDEDSCKSDDNESDKDIQISEDDENYDTANKESGFNSLKALPHLSRTLGDVMKEGLVSFELCLRLTSSPVLPLDVPVQINNNVLCVGSGASILTDWLCSWLSGPPHNVFISKIDCKSMKGKKGENIQKKLSEKLQKCIYYQPSLLVLLDIDAIAGTPTQPENKMEHVFYQGMGRMIRDVLLENQMNQNIGVLATARATNNVNNEVLGPHGYHLFPTLLQIPTLSKEDRIIIIKEIIKRKLKLNNFNGINLDEFAAKTEGYNYEDLILLADKAFFQAWQRKVKDRKNEELVVTVDDLTYALDSYTPTHLHSINLYKSEDHSWISVGGMKALKESLTEVIIWPSKFQEIYKQCPLSSETGVLLYGVPGTGKTLLASALAGEAGLNFISIKGPELLSKYIGASEEAVRKVFEKAKKAKPCILFFDEFDSLAPRRGHDSSGVMDRVVNQLLTQMDGVEERTGVYIIAATSRPDLLDPALLRPGRIGHTLHCPLPDTNDRFEIMEVLSKRLVLDSDINLTFIASQTEGFSGADLQALIYCAQMLAYDDMMNEDKVSSESGTDDHIVHVKHDVSNKLVVKNLHLIAALKDTNPSLRLEELRRYHRIYENFQKMRSKTNVANSLPIEIDQKVTLA